MTAAADETVVPRVALLTSAAPGAIAVIALSGAGTADLIARLALHRSEDRPLVPPRERMTLCRVFDGHEVIDNAMVVTWDDGARAELHCHGGMRVVQRILMRLEQLGAQRVEPEAIDASAPTDPTLAEIDAALQTTPTRRMAEWLLAQRRLLPDFLARCGSQPLPPDEADAVRRRSVAAVRLLRGLRVAIVGPPNAGKSSLANRLIGDERIITSDEPGTTRDWVCETAVLRGWPITLTDTAGIHATNEWIEAESIRRGIETVRDADLALIVVDVSDAAASSPGVIAEIAARLNPDVPRRVVVNKIDLLDSTAAHEYAAEALAVSAKTGAGLDALTDAINSTLELDLLRDDMPTPITPRQRRSIGLPDGI